MALQEASAPTTQPVPPGAARHDRGPEKRVMMSLSFLLAR
jgi:hypothetical protein